MQWRRAGHEFDMEYQKIINQYKGPLIIYGAGMMGRRTYDAVSCLTELTVDAFFDKDKSKTEYKNVPVHTLIHLMSILKKKI